MTPAEFVEKWKVSGGAETANSQLFLTELCLLLDLPAPDATTQNKEEDRYVFEKFVTLNNGDGTSSPGWADLYRSGCFVLESKQGTEKKAEELANALATRTKNAPKRKGTATRGTPGWSRAMWKAREQAKSYAEAIPGEWPPFLVVTDVGYCFDLYADFTGSGKSYEPFPDPQNFRIPLEAIEQEDTRELLRSIWLDPLSLDPSKVTSEVTSDIAERLARLAKSLERDHEPEAVAGFLMRCLFTMFAEDVDLIPNQGFTAMLIEIRETPDKFAPMATELWKAMDEGGFSGVLRDKVPRFNGKFFSDKTAIDLNRDQLELLIEAAERDWQQVEPAIFGTMLERALDPVERHKLGAHYTPRAYVERLVVPTIIEPLREKWTATYAAAIQLDDDGKQKEAIALLRDFHGELCETRVLDPACGSGNFLYVAMELMKKLEGEVVNALSGFDDDVLPGVTIDPHQFLGIEVNPRAAALAELVLWIGFIQWHRRTRDELTPPIPILKDYKNIECRDAVLDWDSIEPVTDCDGVPVTRWDGRTTKPHPVTGEEVPDEDARVQELRYINPRKASWPETDYIVGNPPFIGDKRMRFALGTGYVDSLRSTYESLGGSSDYVMYWWDFAAKILLDGKARQFGLIATNSIRQNYNRRNVSRHLESKNPLSISFAVPDHPWVDAALGAAVRISMSVATAGECDGVLLSVRSEPDQLEGGKVEYVERRGAICADLTIGPNVAGANRLASNAVISCPGVKLFGQGFVVDLDKAIALGLNRSEGLSLHLRPYLTAREVTQEPRNRYAMDFLGLTSDQVKDAFPECYQHLCDYVRPERKQNNRKSYRDNWWLFGEPRKVFRTTLRGLTEQIITPETSRHRFFTTCPIETIVEGTLVVIASDQPEVLGVLSSRPHELWALSSGSRLGVGNDPRYNKTRCFETFPFPVTDAQAKKRIGHLAEQLDAHRKRQQEKHPKLTMTGMYNVLEKLRSQRSLNAKEQVIHEQGLVSVLKQIHDDLDAAVFDAYGWPHDLDDEAILHRLVELNHERADEEGRGLIRWLRPEFQNPDGATQTAFDNESTKKKAKKATAKIKKQPWPKSLPDRMVAIQNALQRHGTPADVRQVAAYYTRANKDNVAELLETLAAVGNVRQIEDGRYVSMQTKAG
tara:strand:- start:769 stop:4203 length:3435 start_codon:yes stop_codon:yes gene_type:complete